MPMEPLHTVLSQIKAEVSDLSSRIEFNSNSSKGLDTLIFTDEPNVSEDSESMHLKHQAYVTEISKLKLMLERDLNIIEDIFDGKVMIKCFYDGPGEFLQ